MNIKEKFKQMLSKKKVASTLYDSPKKEGFSPVYDEKGKILPDYEGLGPKYERDYKRYKPSKEEVKEDKMTKEKKRKIEQLKELKKNEQRSFGKRYYA